MPKKQNGQNNNDWVLVESDRERADRALQAVNLDAYITDPPVPPAYQHRKNLFELLCTDLKYAHFRAVCNEFGLETVYGKTFDDILAGGDWAVMEKLVEKQPDEVKKAAPYLFEALVRDREAMEANRERARRMLENLKFPEYDRKKAREDIEKGGFPLRKEEELPAVALHRQRAGEILRNDTIDLIFNRGSSHLRWASLLLRKPGLSEEEYRSVREDIEQERFEKLYDRFFREIAQFPVDLLRPMNYQEYLDHFEEIEYYGTMAWDSEFMFASMKSHAPKYMSEEEKKLYTSFMNGISTHRNIMDGISLAYLYPALEDLDYEKMDAMKAVEFHSYIHEQAKNEDMKSITGFMMTACFERDRQTEDYIRSKELFPRIREMQKAREDAARQKAEEEARRKAEAEERRRAAREKELQEQKLKKEAQDREIDQNTENFRVFPEPAAGKTDLIPGSERFLPSEQAADAYRETLDYFRGTRNYKKLPFELCGATRNMGDYLNLLRDVRGRDGHARVISARDMDRLLGAYERAEQEMTITGGQADRENVYRARMGRILRMDKPILQAMKELAGEEERTFDELLLMAKQNVLNAPELPEGISGEERAEALNNVNEELQLYREYTLPLWREEELERKEEDLENADDEIWKDIRTLAREMDVLTEEEGFFSSNEFDEMRNVIYGVASHRPETYGALEESILRIAEVTRAYMNAKDQRSFGRGPVDEKDRGKRLTESGNRRYHFADIANRTAERGRKRLESIRNSICRSLDQGEPEALREMEREYFEETVRHPESIRFGTDALKTYREQLVLELREQGFAKETFARFLAADELIFGSRKSEAGRITEDDLYSRTLDLMEAPELELMEAGLNGEPQNLKSLMQAYEAAKEHQKDMKLFGEMSVEALEQGIRSMESGRGTLIHSTGQRDFDRTLLELKKEKAEQLLAAKKEERLENLDRALADLSRTPVPTLFSDFCTESKKYIPKDRNYTSPFSIGRQALGLGQLCILLSQGHDLQDIMLPGRLNGEKERASREAYGLMVREGRQDHREIGEYFYRGYVALREEAKKLEQKYDVTSRIFRDSPEGRRYCFISDAIFELSQEYNKGISVNGESSSSSRMKELAAEDLGSRELAAGFLDKMMNRATLMGQVDSAREEMMKMLTDRVTHGNRVDRIGIAIGSELGIQACFGQLMPGGIRLPKVEDPEVYRLFTIMSPQLAAVNFAQDPRIIALSEKLMKNPDDLALVAPLLQDTSLMKLFKVGRTDFTNGTLNLEKVPTYEEMIRFAKERKQELRAESGKSLSQMQLLLKDTAYTYAGDAVRDGLAAMKRLSERYVSREVLVTERERPEYRMLLGTILRGGFMAQCVKEGKTKEEAMEAFQQARETRVFRHCIRNTGISAVGRLMNREGISEILSEIKKELHPERREQAARRR